ncbi:hypothetical protein IWX47DRAFT_859243 [Phyllosticta citricarpa]
MPGDDSVLSETVYYYTSTLTYAFIAASASLLLLALMLFPTAVLRWLQRKRYQYEVTFSLYMLTPTEKFIFSTCDCLLAPIPNPPSSFARPDVRIIGVALLDHTQPFSSSLRFPKSIVLSLSHCTSNPQPTHSSSSSSA